MRWTLQASACLVALALVGCSGGRDNRNNETGTMSDTSGMSRTPGVSDTSGMSGMSADTGRGTGAGGMRSDTGAGMSRDTARTGGGATRSDSAKANQTKSGVTNTKTGKSTLGPGVTKTRPDQGQPVTSKGDTVNPGVDSTSTQR
jgi:hypothetical protein